MIKTSNMFKTGLVKSTIFFGFSSFINKGMLFLLIPLLTREMSIQEYGILSMINATLSILVPFVGMSIDGAFGRVLAEENTPLNRKYIFNCFVILFSSSSIVSIICLMTKKLFEVYLSISSDLLVLVIFISISDVIIAIVSVIMLYQNRKKAYVLFLNGETILNLVLTMLFMIVLEMSMKGRVYSILCSKIVFAVIAFFLINKYIGIDKVIDRNLIKDELKNFGLPLIPTALKGTILNYLDRIFITNMKTVSDTAYYTLGNQLSMPILFLAQAFNLAYVPWLYKKLSSGEDGKKENIVKMTYVYFILILSVSVLWALIAEHVIDLIAGKDYRLASKYVIWLSLGYAFTGMHMMVVNYIYYAKKIVFYNLVTLTVVVSNLILNYFMINRNGAVGAAQATLIVNIISFILTWILAARIYKMPWILKNEKFSEV